MDEVEIYREFVSQLEKDLKHDAEVCSQDESNASGLDDYYGKDDFVKKVKDNNSRLHLDKVNNFNHYIRVLAGITGQESTELEPKYGPTVEQ